MSTYYMASGETSLQQLLESDKNITILDQTLEEALESNRAIVCKDKEGLHVDLSPDGDITGYTRYGMNDPSFIFEMVPGVSEYTMAEVFDDFEDEEEGHEELSKNFYDYVDTYG